MMDIRPVRKEEEWEHARDVRTRVFVEEQGCDPELEWDQHEFVSRHIVGYLEGSPMAAARWRTVMFEGRLVAKLERFAVLEPYRGMGLGRRLVEFAMSDARAAGFDTFVLHAQQHLEGFYRSFGFETLGEVFEEAGILHVKMVRR
jgi:predicted GNAT family N-acyltransferase